MKASLQPKWYFKLTAIVDNEESGTPLLAFTKGKIMNFDDDDELPDPDLDGMEI